MQVPALSSAAHGLCPSWAQQGEVPSWASTTCKRNVTPLQGEPWLEQDKNRPRHLDFVLCLCNLTTAHCLRGDSAHKTLRKRRRQQ